MKEPNHSLGSFVPRNFYGKKERKCLAFPRYIYILISQGDTLILHCHNYNYVSNNVLQTIKFEEKESDLVKGRCNTDNYQIEDWVLVRYNYDYPGEILEMRVI